MKSPKREVSGAVPAGVGAVTGLTSALTGVAAGAAAGTAGAAAMTSGLAAVGAIVGGEMVAGLAVVSAAPIVGAAGAYGIFKLYKHWASKK